MNEGPEAGGRVKVITPQIKELCWAITKLEDYCWQRDWPGSTLNLGEDLTLCWNNTSVTKKHCGIIIPKGCAPGRTK